jgi:hypothetical protein
MFAVAVLFFAGLVAGSPQQSPKIDVPVLPTEVNQFGGRPGTFHFVTNEQTMADAAQLKAAFAALDRMDAATAELAPVTRERFTADLKIVRAMALTVNERRTGSAGKTAAEVEQILNESKGNFRCGACHGHGMMHGGGMGMQGRMGMQNE